MGLFSSLNPFGGGGGSSFSSGGIGSGNDKSSTTNTTSTNNYADNRQVNDAGGGIAGSDNFADWSTNLDLTTIDQSQTAYVSDSRNLSSSYADNSLYSDSRDFSEHLYSYDSSNRSTDNSVTNYTLSDGGALGVAAGYGRGAFDLALKAQERAAGFDDALISRSFDLARSSATQLATSNSEALGFARDAFGRVVDMAGSLVSTAKQQAEQAATVAGTAYQSAADTATGNKTLIYAALGAVALVGVVVAFKR